MASHLKAVGSRWREYDVPVDWDEIAEVVEDAYRVVAPMRLVAQLDSI